MNVTRSLPALISVLLAVPAVSAQEKKGQKLALLVGVRDYDHPDMRPLRYSENDVVELSKVLKEAGYEVTLLTDGVGEKSPALAPSRANIDKHLAEILAKCKRREDTILLAFAGHGVQPEGDKDAYFCPRDANPRFEAKKTMVSLSKIYDALQDSYAGVKVVLVDACRDDPKLARGRSGITGDNAPRPPRGVAVLFSCAAGEIAYEHEKYKHGVFFHHVLEGLRGKAKDIEEEVTFTSLASYVSRAVARDVPLLIGDGAQQSPNLKADLAGVPPVLAYIKRVETPPEKKAVVSPDAPKFTEAMRHKIEKLNALKPSDWVAPLWAAILADPDGYKELVLAAAAEARTKDLGLAAMGYRALGEIARLANDASAAELFNRAALDAARMAGDKRMIGHASYGLRHLLMIVKKFKDAADVCQDQLRRAAPGEKVYRTAEFLEVLSKQGKFDEALALVDGLARGGDSFYADLRRPDVLIDAGRFAEAAALREKDLAAAMGEFVTLERIAVSDVYRDWNKVDQAVKPLKDVLADPSVSVELLAQAHARLSNILAKHNRDLPDAERHIQTAMTLEKKQVDEKKYLHVSGRTLATFGLVCLRQHRLKEAKDYISRALEDLYVRYDLEVWDHLGNVHLALGDTRAALAAWREGLSLSREDFTFNTVQLRKVTEEKVEKLSK